MKPNRKILAISLFLCLLMSSCGIYFYKDNSLEFGLKQRSIFYPYNDKPEDDSGCYEICMILNKFERDTSRVPIYTGSNFRDPTVSNTYFRKEPITFMTWDRTTDEDCLRSEDCFIWNLKEQNLPPLSEYVVLDTSLNQEYEWKTISYISELKKAGGYTAWLPVICEEDLSKELVAKVQDKLKELSLYNGQSNGIINPSTEKALKQFQKEYQQPYGHWNLASLQTLASF